MVSVFTWRPWFLIRKLQFSGKCKWAYKETITLQLFFSWKIHRVSGVRRAKREHAESFMAHFSLSLEAPSGVCYGCPTETPFLKCSPNECLLMPLKLRSASFFFFLTRHSFQTKAVISTSSSHQGTGVGSPAWQRVWHASHMVSWSLNKGLELSPDWKKKRLVDLSETFFRALLICPPTGANNNSWGVWGGGGRKKKTLKSCLDAVKLDLALAYHGRFWIDEGSHLKNVSVYTQSSMIFEAFHPWLPFVWSSHWRWPKIIPDSLLSPDIGIHLISFFFFSEASSFFTTEQQPRKVFRGSYVRGP